MKSKKGFTLLEVLAVIVVLAVIAVITVPIVTGVMNDAKRNSFKTSMTNLVKAADNYYADNQLEIDKVMTFCFGLSGSTCTSEELKFTGKAPEKGKLIINPDGEISLLDVSNGTYYANYDSSVDDDIVITEDNEIMNRDELTQALKDLQKKLSDTEKALQSEINKKANNTELDKVKTQLNSTTTIANTANSTANSLNTNMLNKTYPVGSIYISYSSTNPASLFGGTWVSYGTGRTLMGISSGSAGGTGGSSTVSLSTANLPSHNHSIPSLSGSTSSAGAHTHSYSGTTSTNGNHNHNILLRKVLGGSGSINTIGFSNDYATTGATTIQSAGNHNHSFSGTTSSAGAHTHSLSTNASTTGASGSGSSFNVQNPYITVYMWRRTA